MQSVSVESRKDSDRGLLPSGSNAGTGIRVGGTQPGVKLYVDDKEIGPLPQELRDLTPGDHVIKVAGSERYQPLEKHVSVERQDRSRTSATVTLKVLKGKATISLGTPGARVFLVSGTDRRELPMLPDLGRHRHDEDLGARGEPARVRRLQRSRSASTTVRPRGATSSRSIRRPPAVGAVGFHRVLRRRACRRGVRATRCPAPRTGPAGRGRRGRARRRRRGRGRRGLPQHQLDPAVDVLPRRQSLGSTPKVHVTVTPGAHTVKFVNSDEGLTKTVSVSVGAGETKPAVAKLTTEDARR